MSKFKRYYSGDKAIKFWEYINHLPEPEYSTIYALGCVLQEIESKVLRHIENFEDRKSSPESKS